MKIYTHEEYDSSLFRLGNQEGVVSVSNLKVLSKAMATNAELKDTHVKLVALLGAKIKAIESLFALQ